MFETNVGPTRNYECFFVVRVMISIICDNNQAIEAHFGSPIKQFCMEYLPSASVVRHTLLHEQRTSDHGLEVEKPCPYKANGVLSQCTVCSMHYLHVKRTPHKKAKGVNAHRSKVIFSEHSNNHQL